MAVRLNGWQRLWVVVSAFYLVLVLGFVYMAWPTADGTRHRDEFITRMSGAERQRVIAAYGSDQEANEAKGLAAIDRDLKDPVIAHFPNGAVLYLQRSEQGALDEISRIYWSAVKAETRAARWSAVGYGLLFWVIPCVVLYALGWSVAWVRRGFRPGP